MSILIKGAKVPRHCGYCFFNDFNICQIEHFTVADAVYHEERHERCPLVEIPPHGRLIDADYMKRHLMFSQGINDCGALYAPYDEIKKEIDRMPTVIESEEQDHEYRGSKSDI